MRIGDAEICDSKKRIAVLRSNCGQLIVLCLSAFKIEAYSQLSFVAYTRYAMHEYQYPTRFNAPTTLGVVVDVALGRQR